MKWTIKGHGECETTVIPVKITYYRTDRVKAALAYKPHPDFEQQQKSNKKKTKNKKKL